MGSWGILRDQRKTTPLTTVGNPPGATTTPTIADQARGREHGVICGVTTGPESQTPGEWGHAPPATLPRPGIRVGNVSSGVSDTLEPRIHTHSGWCPSTRLTGSRYRPPHCCAKRAMTALNRISNTTGPRGDLQRATCRIEFPVSTRVPTSSLDSSLQRKPFGDSQATDPTNPINCCQGLLFDVIVDNRN